jgi:hypothetical protein
MSNTRKRKIMRVELPSGGWVEYRDQLKAIDRFAVQDAVFLEVKDGVNRAALGFGNDIRNALLGRIITGWSFPTPTPGEAKDITAADVVIGNAMDLDDYNALADAVQPLLDKVSGTAKKPDPKKRSDS